MKKLQWLKTKVGLFADPRMMYLLQEKHGDAYVVLWFFLKDMAGTIHKARQEAWDREHPFACLVKCL